MSFAPPVLTYDFFAWAVGHPYWHNHYQPIEDEE